MFEGIFNLIRDIIMGFVIQIQHIFTVVSDELLGGSELLERPVNISLFSDIVIYETKLLDIITLTTVTILLVIIIRFLVKATYNFVKRVFGVFKL